MGYKTQVRIIENGVEYAKFIRGSMKFMYPEHKPITEIHLRLIVHVLNQFGYL
jgi:hypothetical protein